MSYPRHSDEPGVPASPDFPAIERGILAFWKGDDTFQASIDQREGAPEWVFYDGPPFANGLPHYGHLLTGYAKDLFPRYQTMRGKQVHRRFGWDTHGLPAELEAMRQLGITQKEQIEQMGIGAFNAKARESVLRYTKEWEEYVTRQARWVDFENDYKTLDPSYMESVLWAFKRLHDKGLAYEGFRVLPYCWNDQTPLSNHELRMDDDVYQMRQDQSVTVTLPLVGEKAEALGLTAVNALAWTTTPWTLPTNLALAVGPDIAYVVVPAGPDGAADGSESSRIEGGAARYLLAADTVAGYWKDLGYESLEAALAAVEQRFTGVGARRRPLRPALGLLRRHRDFGTHNAWQILVADYVATGEGTGIVHLAPAYGEDDQLVCGEAGIPVILSVDDGGRFLPTVPTVAGLRWDEANRPLTQALRAEGRLLQLKSYEHSYPHCWRCRNPLIYKAVSSWFVKVPEFRDRMGDLNQQINWVPENVKDGQFGKWLSNARDWSISRNRYWGSPIPVWKSDDPEYPRVDVYGSLEELERDFGRPRRTRTARSTCTGPFIDELTRPNPDDPTGQSTMRRIPDVLDVWFDSGSMPFAQVHYPFENHDWFDTHSPADFIVEYIGQTRGWFYLLHVLSTALFDRPAFTQRAQPRHRARQRRPEDVEEPAQLPGCQRGLRPGRRGCDALVPDVELGDPRRQPRRHRGGHPAGRAGAAAAAVEYLLLLHAVRQHGGRTRRQWRTDSQNVLDRYLLAKTREVVEQVTEHLDVFDSPFAAAALRDFGDVLTNWYVRRSRDRFWAGDDADAFDTLYTVLETIARLAAPLLPLVTEELWRGLTGERSVHLADWPDADGVPRRPRPRRHDGPHPRDRVVGPRPAQGARTARASAARPAHRRQRGCRRARRVRGHPARRAQPQGRRLRGPSRVEPRRLRHHPEADRQRPCARARGSARTCSA